MQYATITSVDLDLEWTSFNLYKVSLFDLITENLNL